MASAPRSRVFLDVNIGAEPAGRLTIDLFTDKTPKTCENFRQLCTNSDSDLTYAKSPFHRIIDEFMIQGGDITAGDGTGGKSIYNNGAEFEDENLGWRDMDAAGLVCMANRGKDTNSSQFFITLEPCPHLNGKHTIFGQLASGREVLDAMAKVRVNDDDVPSEPVLVARCGELERKSKPSAPSKPHSPERPALRGRRPSSPSVTHTAQHQRSPGLNEKRKRRQSDALIDETLRGRPRARSDDEAADDTSAADNAVTSDQSRSPAEKHRRQRSPSPRARHVDRAGEDGEHERRRRRSLPNQYQDHRQDSERRDRNRPRRGHGTGEDKRHDRTNDRRDAGARDWDDPRAHQRRNDRHDDGGRDNRGYGRRQQDSYRPSRDGRDSREGRGSDGRLGGDSHLASGAAGGDGDGAIKFKGRGSMKFREPDRRW